MSLPITVVNCPTSKYSIKCPYAMVPEGIVVHNTYNDASAMAEISYMQTNDNLCSFHYAVDHERAVQGLPLNRNSFNAGDGATGRGNRKMIAIEICYSKSGGSNFTKAEQNAAKLVAKLLKQYGWGINKVTKHQDYSSKYCPHRTLDLGWVRFLNMVQAELDILNKKSSTSAGKTSTTTSSKLKYKVGDKVTFNGVYTSSSSTKKLTPAVKSGKITKIVTNAKNPYLIDKGNVGWVNESCITSGKTTSTKTSTTKKEYKVGDTVKINGVYTSSSSTKKLTPAVKSGKITKIVKGVKNPYLLNNGDLGWVNKDCIVK